MVNNAVNGTVQICIPLRSVTAPRRDVLAYPAVDTGPELPVAPRVVKRYDIAREKKVKTKASFFIFHEGTTLEERTREEVLRKQCVCIS